MFKCKFKAVDEATGGEQGEAELGDTDPVMDAAAPAEAVKEATEAAALAAASPGKRMGPKGRVASGK